MLAGVDQVITGMIVPTLSRHAAGGRGVVGRVRGRESHRERLVIARVQGTVPAGGL